MDDNKILDLYFARSEQAIMETEQKYGSYCFHIASYILSSIYIWTESLYSLIMWKSI